MTFSLYDLIQSAADENAANDYIFKANKLLLRDNFNSFSIPYVITGIFEVDEIEDFSKALQENLTQFVKEYKEKCKNVQNY